MRPRPTPPAAPIWRTLRNAALVVVGSAVAAQLLLVSGSIARADFFSGFKAIGNAISSGISTLANSISPTAVQTEDQILKKIEDQKQKKADEESGWRYAAGVALRAALSHFVNTLAYDSATKLASGGRGQKALFETEGWGAYLQNTADEAAGHFIETFAKADPLKSLGVEGLTLGNLCSPKFDLKLRIGLGLLRTVRPRRPACTWTDFSDNWKNAIDDPQFLERLAPSFNPWENEAGIALGVYTNFYGQVFNSVDAARQRRLEGQGFRPVETLTGKILTPPKAVSDWWSATVDAAVGKEFAFTGDVFADGVGVFVNTLTGKLAERLFEKGLAGAARTDRFDWSKLEGVIDRDASARRSGAADARREFANLLTANAAFGDPTADRLPVTTLLLGDGIINVSFKQAIDQGKTVRQAIDEGLLAVNGPGSTFGYSGPGQEPDARSGYGASAMMVLRKYRILPVGWELAAAYVGSHLQGKVYGLGDVLAGYDDPDSPFYRLVDEHWVLKAPNTYCRLQGATDRLSAEVVRRERVFDTSVDPPVNYDIDRRQVTRVSECVDSRSCIAEDEQGVCRTWGVCTEEKPVWRFGAEACLAPYVGCTTYAPRDGDPASYLAATVSSDACNSGNVGCQWYCREFNAVSNEFTCAAEGSRVARACESPAPGCVVTDAATGRSCTIPPGGTSCRISACAADAGLAPNASFEAQSPDLTPGPSGVQFAEDWTTRDAVPNAVARVSGAGNQVFGGRYSVRIFADSAAPRLSALSNLISVKAGAAEAVYTLTGRVYSTLSYGAPIVRAVEWDPLANPPTGAPTGERECATDRAVAKSAWTAVTCEVAVSAGDSNWRLELVVDNAAGDGGRTTPVGTVWFDDLGFQPSCPTQDLIVPMVGTAEALGSKLFLDEGAQACGAADAGCSALVRLTEGLGTNLLPNGGFELLDPVTSLPQGWASTVTATAESDTPPEGSRYLRLGSTSRAVLISDAMAGVTDDGSYRVSLAARGVAGTTLTVDLRDDDAATADLALLVANQPIVLAAEWQRFLLDAARPLGGRAGFRLAIGTTGNATVDLDALMVEGVPPAGGADGSYRGYGEANQLALKLPPAYLKCTGDPATDAAVCAKYAGVCTSAEVGCQRYTPSAGGPPIPGIARPADACPAECVGYTAYKQSATNFEAEKFPRYFIESTATQCEANDAGCEEFTNLDTVAAGGEGRELFTYVRQCSKPNPTTCGTFYSWVGSDVSGYQLRTHNLRDLDRNNRADIIANPLVSIGSLGPCATEADAATNPNCRQLFSATGVIDFALYPQTVSCDSGCHPYRLADSTQADCEGSGGFWGTCKEGDFPPGTTCESIGGMKLVGSTDCYAPQAACEDPAAGNSSWTPRNQCVYQFLASEGRSCSAAAAGCREYRGNAGPNVRNVFADTFEDDDFLGWTSATGARVSTESTSRSGHSLLAANPTTISAKAPATDGAGNTLGACRGNTATTNPWPACTAVLTSNCYIADARDAHSGTCAITDAASGQRCFVALGESYCGPFSRTLQPSKTYLVSFWAKSNTGGIVSLRPALHNDPTRPVVERFNTNLIDGQPDVAASPSLRISADWQPFTLPPLTLPKTVGAAPGVAYEGAEVQLMLNTTGSVFVDNVEVKEVQAYSYRIKNSWQTPPSCDTNPDLDPVRFPAPNAPQFMLGCAAYSRSGGGAANLKSFTRLCRDAAVGCEAFLDTRNSESPFAETFNAGGGAASVVVPADGRATYVNDGRRACTAEAVGCSALGRPQLDPRTGAVSRYATTHLINRPSDYGDSLCTADAVGCAAYTSETAGITYFKNPGLRTCEYRQISGSEQYGWFITGSTSAAPDCSTAPKVLGNPQPAATCQGGDRAGAVCASDADCGVRVCRGGPDDGTPCGGAADCSTRVCELSAGSCVPWAGLCPTSAASCTAYVDPLSSTQANSLPNGNFEGTYKVCSNGLTACATDADCSALPAIGGVAQTCDQRKFTFWADAPADTVQLNAGRANSTAVQLPSVSGLAQITQGRSLDGGTLYAVSLWTAAGAAATRLELRASVDGAFTDFDHSVEISPNGRTVTLAAANPDAAYQRYAGRFLTAVPLTGVQVVLVGPARFEDVTLAPASVTYALARQVDSQSCNGIVNEAAGCVLFNDTSDAVLKFSSAASSADAPPASCGSVACDSNLLLKVRPDRQCAKWLDCIATRDTVDPSSGEKVSFCQRLATCDSLNPTNGKCNSYPADQTTPVEYTPATVDALRYVTGASKVGFTWAPDAAVPGYLPYAAMPQQKVCVSGDPAKRNNPCFEDAECNSSTAFAADGSCQPILKVRGVDDPLTVYGSCRIYPESDSPRFGEFGPADTGSQPAKSLVVDVINPLPRAVGRAPEDLAGASECRYTKDTTIYSGLSGFCVERDPRNPYRCLNWLPLDELTGGWSGDGWAETLRKPLYACSEGEVLEARTPTTFTVNKCYKGLLLDPGFALSDFVSDAIGVGGGPGDLSGKPYTIASTSKCGNVACPIGYRPNVRDKDCSTTFEAGRRCYWECIPDATDLYRTDSATDGGTKWYAYHDRMDRTGKYTKKHLIYCPTCGAEGKVMWDPENPGKDQPAYWLRTCSKVAKLAQEDGTNIGWKERLEVLPEFAAANYEVPSLRFTLETQATPFGMLGAKYAGDPADWPLIEEKVLASAYRSPKLPDYPGGDAGQPYFQTITRAPVSSWGSGVERLKRLFATSYGYFQFSGTSYSSYTIINGDQYCHGGPRNGTGCSAGPAVCEDPGSRCDQSGGSCAYQDTLGTADETDDVWVQNEFGACGNNAECATDANLFCATGFCRTDDGVEGNDSNRPCSAAQACTPPETCSQTALTFGVCAGDRTLTCIKDPQDCQFPDGRDLGPCDKSVRQGFCSGGLQQKQACTTNAGCQALAAGQSAWCVGRCQQTSVRRNQTCYQDTQCAIDGECRAFPAWQPPELACPNRTRPTSFTDDAGELTDLDPNNNADWCAIAPVVYNLKLENSEAPQFQISGGSGSVSVVFNVRADANQLPLRLLQVDWGDGAVELPSVPALGFNHRPDPRSPFSFSHTYTYQAACDDPTTSELLCTHTIRVRVRDNWGWWSGTGGYVADPNPALYPADAWVTVPAEIQVFAP